jgi:hypothetical protein
MKDLRRGETAAGYDRNDRIHTGRGVGIPTRLAPSKFLRRFRMAARILSLSRFRLVVAAGDGMPIVLLVLGAVTTLAGLVLTASGLTIRDGSFDTEVLTPGTIAVIGGLVLIGLGFVVRALRRIERALVARPMPRVSHADELAAVTAAETAMSLPSPTPMIEPPQPASADLPSAEAPAIEASIEDAAFESLRVKFPALARTDNSRFVDAADVSLALREAAGLREGAADLRRVAAVGRAANGAGTTARVVPRVDPKARQASPSGKAKISVFSSFWPAAPRRGGQAAAQVAAPAPLPIVHEPVSPAEPVQPPPLPDPGVSRSSAPVSVLKSGVVEGMAYTLYSDGSIEAQLPQGTLRFGSISALRSHIENTA